MGCTDAYGGFAVENLEGWLASCQMAVGKMVCAGLR